MSNLTTSRILVLDDDPGTCRFMQELLTRPDREIETSLDPEQALSRVRVKPFDLVISDLKLNARLDGIDVLRSVRDLTPGTPVIIVTGFGELEKAVEAVREGAFDFVSKPFNITELKGLVERALQKAPAAAPPTAVRDNMPPALLGRTPVMTGVYKQIAHAASSDAPVLIIGESGTGKELVARAIHQHSNRSARPFVPINCGALTETLLESELFGHTKGSFTGAINDAKGVFQTAHTGTVFLDEVGEMSPGLQVKLLRVLQEGEVRPVGATETRVVDVRILSATHRNLEEAISAEVFREDLYYRLNVVNLMLPPLRERREDIPPLAQHFLGLLTEKYHRRIHGFAPEALEMLSAADWPGNIRQLRNVVEQCCALCTTATIPVTLVARALRDRPAEILMLAEARSAFERDYLITLLKLTRGQVSEVARLAGRNRTEVYRLLQRHNLTPALFKDRDESA